MREERRVLSSRSRGRDGVCGGGGRESFSGRAPLFGPTTTPPPPPPNSLSNARARAHSVRQIKRERLRRTSDNWTFAKEREIFRRSPLRVVRNEAEPFCVLSRRRDVILRARDFSNDRTRVSARAPCGALLRVLQVARARTAKRRAPSLQEREKGSRENLSRARAMRFGSRSRPRVRVHEAYLACVFIF